MGDKYCIEKNKIIHVLMKVSVVIIQQKINSISLSLVKLFVP